MDCVSVKYVLGSLARWLWHIPEGFATLMAGGMTLIAALIALYAVLRQINANKATEAGKAKAERSAVEVVLRADLLVYASAIIPAVSNWNGRSSEAPDKRVENWPVFPYPKVYEFMLPRMGLISEGWPVAAMITFYTNLLDLIQIGENPHMVGRPEQSTNVQLAKQGQMMAINLAAALDGLLKDKPQAIPSELDVPQLIKPNGEPIGHVRPASLQQVLRLISSTVLDVGASP